MISKSPDRYTFQKQSYMERNPEADESDSYLEIFDSMRRHKENQYVDPEWQKDNLEYDLRTTQWILDKARASDAYAQNLYASMCNNEFTKNDVVPILTEKKWHCSWRYAGGIVADMQEKGDYIDWYCSGIRNHEDMADDPTKEMTEEGRKLYEEVKRYVSESVVTDEIREDLLKLGWIVIDEEK